MRTKNAKRLWPVPATLTVVALAAFLAFGLMATTGAQPAAAQADPDCKVANTGPAVPNTADTPNIASTIEACNTSKSSVVIALEGSLGLEDDDDLVVWVYAKGGSIAGGTTLNNVWDHDAEGAATDSPKATRFSGIRLEIPEGIGGGIGGGGDKRQTADITVTPASGNDDVVLYVYYQAASPIGETSFDHDLTDNDASPEVFQIGEPSGASSVSMMITFLGAPAVGTDGVDFNDEVDDDVFDQCYLTADTRMEVVLEDESCPGTHTNDMDITDEAEIRSKLVAVSGTNNPVTTPQVDGTTEAHKPDGETSATVYAVIQDANGNHLEGAEVNFSATIEPQSVADALDFDTDRDVDAKTVGAGEGEINIAGDAEGVEGDYAVAVREINGLPSNSPYKITITVTAEGVPLGEIVISRDGTADKVLAAIFSADCFTPGGTQPALDYSRATFNMNDDDCEEIGASGRFGHGQMVFVKSHIEDALDNIIGDGTDLDSELANEDDDLLDDGDPTIIEDPVDASGDPARAWLYMIHEDAALGDHMITVSTDTKGVDDEGDERDIADVTLTVTVAGPPASLEISGDGNVDLGGSETFTVTAEDANNGVPHLTTSGPDQNDMVTVLIQPNTALVDGLNASNQVMLDPETGTAEFTVYAALDAEDGDQGRLIARLGELQDIEPITFGEPGATPDPMERDGFTADYTVDATSTAGSGMVDVSWTRSDELSLSLVSLIKGDEVVDFNITPGMSTGFSGVDPGEYDVSVFSFRNNADGKDGEIAFGTVTVE